MDRLLKFLALVTVIAMNGIIVVFGTGFFNSVTRLFAIPLVLLWLIVRLVDRKFERLTAFHGLYIAYVAFSLATILWSKSADLTYYWFTRNYPLITLLFVMWDVFRTKKDADLLLKAYIASGYLIAATVVYNRLQGVVMYDVGDRVSGFGLHPNDVALLLSIPVPIAIAYGALMKETPNWQRALFLLYVPLAIYGGLQTGSRGSIVALVPSFVWTVWQIPKMTGKLRLGVTIGLVATLAITPFILSEETLGRVASITSVASADKLTGRVDIWDAAWNEFAAHPILGIGDGAFKEVSRNYGVHWILRTGEGIVVHNTWLSILVEKGVVGMGLFLSMIYCVIVAAKRTPQPLGAAMLMALTVYAIGVNSVTFENRQQSWLLFFILFIVGARIGTVPKKVKRPLLEDPYKSKVPDVPATA